MDRIYTTVDTCGSAVATSGQATSATATSATASGGAAGGTPEAGDADPEIAIATRGTRPGPVAVYLHGVPSPAAAAAVLTLARACGPVRVQRVIVPGSLGAADADPRLPRALDRAGAEVLLCLGADRLRVLANAWHDLVVDDLARHADVRTVVLAGAPAAVVARLAPVLRGAGVQCLRLRQPVGMPVVAQRAPVAATAAA